MEEDLFQTLYRHLSRVSVVFKAKESKYFKMVLLIFLDYQLTGRLRLIVHGPTGEGCGSIHT